MGWSMCLSTYCVLSVHHFLGEVQCKTHSTCNIICLPSTTHFSIQGNSLDITSRVGSWAGKGVDQRTFGPIATPPTRLKRPQSNPPGGIEKCKAAPPRKASNRPPPKINKNSTNASTWHTILKGRVETPDIHNVSRK